ncbi:MAG: cation transporter [Dehalococcoidia bacterium]|nr:MAG: cation transporter [Dehalococcoidia bacterium]
MSHDHGSIRAGARHVRPLTVTFALVVTFLAVEAVAGLLTNSLALLSDAGHMLTDAVGLGMSLAAIVTANRPRPASHRTFGFYRLEIVAALVNALLLFVVAGYVLFEATKRFSDPPEVASTPMLIVAIAGLAVNIVGLWLLRAGSRESMNVEGAFMEVMADFLGSIGVIVAALVTMTTGWLYADPLFGAALGVFILPRAARLGLKALRVLVQAAPPDMDLSALEAELVGINGVVEVHDLHVWTLTSEMEVASMHLMTNDQVDPHIVLDQAETLLRERYHIGHATLQIEPESHRHCVEVGW